MRPRFGEQMTMQQQIEIERHEPERGLMRVETSTACQCGHEHQHHHKELGCVRCACTVFVLPTFTTAGERVRCEICGAWYADRDALLAHKGQMLAEYLRTKGNL